MITLTIIGDSTPLSVRSTHSLDVILSHNNRVGGAKDGLPYNLFHLPTQL
jgi:hypothetical protein